MAKQQDEIHPDYLEQVTSLESLFVCWSLTSLCHSNGHIETMPAREINPFTVLTRIRSQFLRTQWSTSNHSEWTRLRLRPLSHRGWLTSLERELVKSQLLVTVRGKRGSPVQILMPHDCQLALDYLANPSIRQTLEIKNNVERGCDILFHLKECINRDRHNVAHLQHRHTDSIHIRGSKTRTCRACQEMNMLRGSNPDSWRANN